MKALSLVGQLVGLSVSQGHVSIKKPPDGTDLVPMRMAVMAREDAFPPHRANAG
jgi:hypothetical protein